MNYTKFDFLCFGILNGQYSDPHCKVTIILPDSSHSKGNRDAILVSVVAKASEYVRFLID